SCAYYNRLDFPVQQIFCGLMLQECIKTVFLRILKEIRQLKTGNCKEQDSEQLRKQNRFRGVKRETQLGQEAGYGRDNTGKGTAAERL
ncbi:MAG: hypothetical protein NC121_05355, partial [Blautia sp.]|nr:hypothetical protein [Blautia sp.]